MQISNCAADQRLCLCYTAQFPYSLYLEFQIFSGCTAQLVLDLVRNSKDRFSLDAAHLKSIRCAMNTLTSQSSEGSFTKISIVLSSRSESDLSALSVWIIVLSIRPFTPRGSIRLRICLVRRKGSNSGTGRNWNKEKALCFNINEIACRKLEPYHIQYLYTKNNLLYIFWHPITDKNTIKLEQWGSAAYGCRWNSK